jgi:hypothetical protein
MQRYLICEHGWNRCEWINGIATKKMRNSHECTNNAIRKNGSATLVMGSKP